MKLKTDGRCKLRRKENQLGSSGSGALKMINKLQSVKENCQGMPVLMREFDIKFANLAKKPKKTMILNS